MARSLSVLRTLTRRLGNMRPTLSTKDVRLFHLSYQSRFSSHTQMQSGQVSVNREVTLNTINSLYQSGEPILALTAYDFPTGSLADSAGMEIVLVGDSLAMVAMGKEDTNEVQLDEMLLHCRSVSRAVKSAFTVGDLPMGSYEVSSEQALGSSIRLIKEGRVKAVKLEGGIEMAPSIKKITAAGIPVLGHIGLTPQRLNVFGGFRVQGKTSASALKILEDAIAIQEAGCFAIVIEAVPAEVASIITAELSIPTIGIGAGCNCSGQVLVQSDLTGSSPQGRSIPRFVKQYCNVWNDSLKGIKAYRDDAKSKKFPATEHTYPISKAELMAFQKLLSIK